MSPSLLAPLALAIALLIPSAAQADSTLDLEFGSQYELESTTAGEVNDYLVSFDIAASQWVFTERAVGENINIGVAPGCVGGASPEVRCPAAGINGIALRPGPGNDNVAGGDPLPLHAYNLDGGTGNDTLDGSQFRGFMNADGGDGNDTITPTRALRRDGTVTSFVTPGAGNDTVLESVAGTRVIVFASVAPDGVDTLMGGAGFDDAEYENRAARVELSADGVANDGEPGEGDNIAASVEALRGGYGNDLLVASNLVDSRLSGYDGNDDLRGGAADDILFGGADDDNLDGGAGDDLFPSGDGGVIAIGGGPTELGADVFTGGPGTDTIEFEGRLTPVVLTQNGQSDDGEEMEGDNIGSDIETLIGGDAGDQIVATAASQRIFGGPGGDSIDDGGGGDYVRGEGHDDTITARDGAADDIGCGSGTDTLIGDDIDATDGTCETVDAAATPKPVPPDTTAPAVTVSKCKKKLKRKAFFKKGARCTLASDEAAEWQVSLLARARRARISARRYNLELATTAFSNAGQAVRLKVPKKLLRGSRRFKLQLRIVAVDAAGNTTVITRKLRVR